MKTHGIAFSIALVLSAFGLASSSELSRSKVPLKYISSCELDFNNDDVPDIALLLETLRGHERIVLMKTDKGYDAYGISKKVSSMHLSCRFGKFIKETPAGKGEKEGRTYKTPGTYIQLGHPEGPSVAYFWNGSGFKEVWTGD
jgi:hypothetical protein